MAVQVSHLLLFILAFSTTVLDSSILGKSPFISNAFFFNIVQTAFDPLSPPLVLNMYVANFLNNFFKSASVATKFDKKMRKSVGKCQTHPKLLTILPSI